MLANKFAKTWSYREKILRNIEINYLFHFKVYFYVPDTFNISYLSAFNLPRRLKYAIKKHIIN